MKKVKFSFYDGENWEKEEFFVSSISLCDFGVSFILSGDETQNVICLGWQELPDNSFISF